MLKNTIKQIPKKKRKKTFIKNIKQKLKRNRRKKKYKDITKKGYNKYQFNISKNLIYEKIKANIQI